MLAPKVMLNDGVEIPVVGLGTWLLEGPICEDIVKKSLEIGFRHFDTAYIYSNHEQVRDGIKGFDRENLFLTTKLWREQAVKDQVELALDLCLKQLDVDYIDLFLIHWPDNSLKMYETIYEMERLKKMGKIRSVGVSNFTIHHLQDLIDKGLKVSVNQVEFHPFLNQEELLDFSNKNDITTIAYCPLARGEILNDPIIAGISKKYFKTPSQVVLKWLLQKGMIVIPKTSSIPHLKENLNLFDFEIKEEDMRILDNISKTTTKRFIKPDFHEFDY